MKNFKSSIVNTISEDCSTIYELYDNAITYQERNYLPVFKGYDRELLDKEIADLTHYKILIDDHIAGFFSAGDAGPLETELWKEKTSIKSLYLNRIVTDKNVKGRRLFSLIVEWANTFALKRGYKYLRLDTWADNPSLISYYSSFGFKNLGVIKTSNSSDLYIQYRNLNLLIMEKEIAI